MAIATAMLAFACLGGTGLGRDASARTTSGLESPEAMAAIAAAPVAAAPLAAASAAAGAPLSGGPRVIVESWADPAAARPSAAVPEVDPIVEIGPGPGATAVFLGDSYTSGWNGAGLGRRGWPALVGVARGWHVANLAVPGTGFMNPGWTGQPIGSRIDPTIRRRPDIVFVVAGHNDSRWSAATTNRAAASALLRLRAALPRAVIVIVAPIWQNGAPPLRCLVLRDGLRRVARTIDAVFVDPLADRWFTGASHRFIGADGFHPTDRGHRYIADRILAGLREG